MSNKAFTHLAGLFGILAPVCSLTLIFISIAMSPWFSWHDNALSDMGVSRTPNPFNVAIFIGGMMYLVFVLGFIGWHGSRSPLMKIGSVAMILGAIGLTLVSLVTENAGRIHYYIAATYFLATPLAYVMFGTDMLRRSEKIPGVLTVAAGIATVVAIGLVPHKRIAVPEILATVVMSAWTFSMGVKMLVEPAPQPEKL